MAANVEKILRRHDQIKRKRTTVEQHWRDCFDWTYPLRGAKLAVNAGGGSVSDPDAFYNYARQQTAKITDTTGTDAVRTLAAALVAGGTPNSSRWPGLGIGNDEADDENAPDDARIFLGDAADTIWRDIHSSNFDTVILECSVDEVTAGLFYLFVDEEYDDEGMWRGYTFEQWSIASTWATSSKKGGPLDIFHREISMSAEQAVEFYGEENCSAPLRNKAMETPFELVTIIQVVAPRPAKERLGAGRMAKNMPILSCHIERDTKHLLRESGYQENPVIAPRWTLIPDSDYPVGAVYDALPDIKTLNKAVEMSFANMDLAIAGMWIGEDDGVLNPRTLKVGPRKVVVANSVDSLKPLVPAGKFDLAAVEVQRLQRSVRKMLMADALEPQEKGQRTATEVTVNVELLRQLLGPVYGRWQAEFVKPLVERCFGLALRAGRLGYPPDSLRGQLIRVRYKGPLARSQQMVDVTAMDRFETTLAQEAAAGKPEVMDNYDWDNAARTRAELLGVPARLIVPVDERDKARQARAQTQAQQQAVDTALKAAPVIAKVNSSQGAPV